MGFSSDLKHILHYSLLKVHNKKLHIIQTHNIFKDSVIQLMRNSILCQKIKSHVKCLGLRLPLNCNYTELVPFSPFSYLHTQHTQSKAWE